MIFKEDVDLYHDAEKHTYHDSSGKPHVSITDVLAAEGFVDGWFAEPRELYLERGSKVAYATQLYDQGTLKWSSLRAEIEYQGKTYPWTLGYVKAYAALKKEKRLKPLFIEQPLFDPVAGYAGKPDRYTDSTLGHITLQIKTGPVKPWVALQTAAEERLVALNFQAKRAWDESTPNRYGVQLKPDGTYKLSPPFTNPADIRVFLAAVTCNRWRAVNGGLK